MDIEKYMNPTYKVVENNKTMDNSFIKVQSKELDFLINTRLSKATSTITLKMMNGACIMVTSQTFKIDSIRKPKTFVG